jgi:enamine deaminase RidA (YjgF/YER057c/UK114 family)
MTRRLISTGSPFEKTAGYSRAVVDGDWCFVAGTTGYDYASMTMPESVEAQTQATCLATIEKTALQDGRLHPRRRRPRTRYYVTDRALCAEGVYPILGEHFGDDPPRRDHARLRAQRARDEDRDRGDGAEAQPGRRMNLHGLLQARATGGKPVRAGLIGAGKFGSMFLSQVPTTAGLTVTVIADLSPDRARDACRSVGWTEDRIAATRFVEDGSDLCASDDVDVVIDATGSPGAGVVHALSAIENGKHIVMVNVEADVLAGPALAARARSAGTVYSMAYGDQPALVSEMVDWARAAVFAFRQPERAPSIYRPITR